MAQHAGLRSDDQGLLWFGSRLGMPRRAQLRFSSLGIRVLQREQVVDMLAWDDCRVRRIGQSTWWVQPRFGGAGPTTVEIGIRDGGDVRAVSGIKRWKLRDPATSQLLGVGKHEAGVVLTALCEYVAATPDARPGLDDPSRCERLVGQLRSAGLEGPSRKQERLNAGRKGEAREVVRQTAEAHMRYFRGRTVSGDRLLTPEELAALALQGLPTLADAEWKDPEKLRALAAEQLSITPWPFGVLRTG